MMRMSKRNKKNFSKKDENFSENKEKQHGEENDFQNNNEDVQKKQEGLLKEGCEFLRKLQGIARGRK